MKEIDIRNFGDLNMKMTLEPEDFSINLIFNEKAVVRIRPEQWKSLVDGVTTVKGCYPESVSRPTCRPYETVTEELKEKFES